MFTGRAALSLDSKGRIAIPTRFREKLMASCEGRVVLTQHPMDTCLSLYPQNNWEEVARQVASLGESRRNIRTFKRRFLGQAIELQLDSNGRILIPGELREMAELDKKAMLVGQLSRFEIWSEALWEEQQAPLEDGDLPEDLIDSLAL